MKRILLAAGGATLVALLAVGVYVYVQLDWLVHRAIESYGSDILQAEVAVAKVQLSPQKGQGEIGELRVGNPKGFNSKYAAVVGGIDLVLDPASLTDEVVHIKKILVDRPRLTYEQNASGSNFAALQRNVARYIGETSPQEKRASKRLIVDELRIRGAQVSYVPLLPTAGMDLSFTLPDIHLRNLGKSRGGLTPAELTQAVVNAILNRTVSAIGRAAVPRLLDDLLNR